MARNDGIDRTFARNQDLPTLDDVAKVQEHNEREKDSYSNQDIDTTQTYRNIHFKAPTDSSRFFVCSGTAHRWRTERWALFMPVILSSWRGSM